MTSHGTTPRRRRTIGSVALMLLTAAGVLALSPSSSAAPLLPTKTALATSANPSFDGNAITYTATITILGTNLGPITPKGSVVFAAEGPDETTIGLGTVPVSSCIILLSKCTASVTHTFPAADDPDYLQYFQVTATYSGDSLAKPSAGSVDQVLGYPHACDTGLECSEFMVSQNGTTGLEVTVPEQEGEPTDYKIRIGFESAPLGCTTKGTGDTAVYDVDLEAAEGKMVDHVTFGAAAEKAKSKPDRICWQADAPFTGSSPVGDGMHEGLLQRCDNGTSDNPDDDVAAPCVESSWYLPPAPSEGGQLPSELHTYIATPPGDPKSTR